MAHRNIEQMQNKLRIKKLPMKSICLTMIVRNESANIVRLLDSVKPMTDFVSIVDTGSTDDTIKVINDWCKKNNMPGKVHQEPFVDFGHNRTHSIIKARETFPTADYFLLSDADFVWKINKGVQFKKFLFAEKILVAQKSNELFYTNIRLLSSTVDWSCIGVTHEHWQENPIQSRFKGEIQTHTITAIEIDDREDGGCKTDKYVRDKRLLTAGLADPNITEALKIRYTFYMAQTLKCLTEYEESIEMYKKRISLGGWYEEVYYSNYQIGINYKNLTYITRDLIRITIKEAKEEVLTDDDLLYLKNWRKDKSLEELQVQFEDQIKLAEKWFVEAFTFCSTRSESLYHLTTMLRDFSRHELAYTYATMGNKIKFPEKESLFIEKDAYSWGFNYELSIICYYLKKFDEGLEICEALLEDVTVPKWVKNAVEKTVTFYI